MPPISSPPPAVLLRSRVGRVCVAVSGDTVEQLLQRAEAAIAESQFLEFRLDSLCPPQKPAAAIPVIAQFLAEHKDVAAIATCRRKPFGGEFVGTLAEELRILKLAADSGFAILDLEIESAEACEPEALEALRSSGAALLLSFHDFKDAIDPEPIFERIQRFSPDFVKIVSTAHSLMDSLQLLQWLRERSSEAQLIAIAMGDCGVVSRILSLRAGAAFTFASAPVGNPTASGQMTALTLKNLFHIEQLDSATRIYGVAGNPVSHSLSPLMLNTAFHRERINAVYLPLKTDSLEDLLTLARRLPLSGLSVTMPLKQHVLPYLANTDPLTARLGACNTIRLGADGKLYGFNTDVAGIVRPLEKRIALKGANILVLGAGGAARAAIYGLMEKGARVTVWSRNEALAHELAVSAGAATIRRTAIAATEYDVLINATPCGMAGHAQTTPLQDHEWHARLVFDLVYTPLETPLLQRARERQIAVIPGYEMFVHQGARQFELWTGKPAPEAEMLHVILHALKKLQ